MIELKIQEVLYCINVSHWGHSLEIQVIDFQENG